jgi:hypothetical protein
MLTIHRAARADASDLSLASQLRESQGRDRRVASREDSERFAEHL